MKATEPDEIILARTRDWLEKAVIGLNLCPFAKAVYAQGQIRYVVSSAQNPQALLLDLQRELLDLMKADPKILDTTLVIHPQTLQDFLDFNDFSELTGALVDALGMSGEIQIATFHPQYQFAGTSPDDITNHSNRSPYPILQLLRESSVEAAIDQYGDTNKIFERNIETLRRLGLAGWKKLGLGASGGG